MPDYKKAIDLLNQIAAQELGVVRKPKRTRNSLHIKLKRIQKRYGCSLKDAYAKYRVQLKNPIHQTQYEPTSQIEPTNTSTDLRG